MAEKRNTQVEAEETREIVVSRVFDAPRELVWKVWTEPEHVAQWWGPRGFSTTIHEMDVRPGGVWKQTLHGPDGMDYPNHSVFKEVVKPERIVFTHGGKRAGGPGVSFQSTWTFESLGENKTRVTMRGVFASAAERDRVVKEFNAIEGGNQTMERLGEHLANLAASSLDRPFTITRVFKAPRAVIWKLWTECEHLKHWWGPKDFKVTYCKNELRPGGRLHYCLRAPDGSDIWGKFTYREIVVPERLVFINSFSDEQGGTTRHPMNVSWPLELLSTITFVEKDGQTAVTVNWVSFNASEEERRAFAAGRGSMQQGWTGTLDQLAAYVAKI